MSVAFFTPRSVKPLHPRLISFGEYFKKKGISVDFITKSDYKSTLASRINWLYLWFFDLYAIRKCKPLVKNYDIIFVTDLRYLPLARYAHNLGKIVIYDTIDHNVYLRLYQLESKFPIVKVFRNAIIQYFKKIELRYALRYSDAILVNSMSLKTYFKNQARVLFYSSPFEKTETTNTAALPAALLYLGIFSPEKGGHEILHLQKKLNFPLYIFGDISTADLTEKVKAATHVHHTHKISVDALDTELKQLLLTQYLVGFSLIKPAHYSYEVQEANKDIDYLALGIPLIGNYRLPTKEKIEAGCGVFFDDPGIVEKLNDLQLRDRFTMTCKQYYHQHYASQLFDEEMDRLLESLPQKII